jgi:hypothetical protein
VEELERKPEEPPVTIVVPNLLGKAEQKQENMPQESQPSTLVLIRRKSRALLIKPSFSVIISID